MRELDITLEPARAFLVQIGQFLPRLGVALAILVAGWLIAKAVRFAFSRGLRAINFQVLTERAGVDRFLHDGGIAADAIAIFAGLAYWLVLLLALLVAFNSLGLDYATDLVRRVVLFVPKVFVALLVIAFGTYFARFVCDSITVYLRNVGVGDADMLGHLAQYAIVGFVVLIAIDQLDIGGRLVQTTFLIMLGGLVFALALAFGLGGRDRAAALLERWFPRQRPPQ
jgi:hypothetical protein